MAPVMIELANEYQEYLRANSLPQLSADELLLEVDLTEEQCVFVQNFIHRWDDAEDWLV